MRRSLRLRRLAALVGVVFVLLVLLGLAQAQTTGTESRLALISDLRGAIGPATARHVADAVTTASDRSAEVLVLRINTPGGLATSMRDVVTTILGSPVPVVGFVAPSGSHAASAGLYVLYASHIAAMAPGTNTGSATPVQIGAPQVPNPMAPDRSPGEGDGDAPPSQGDAATSKAVNDAVAYIRSLAELRGRNAVWAEEAVRSAASLSANKALEQGVIDIVARDVDRLLAAIDGRRVEVGGSERVLATAGIATEHLEPSAVTRLLAIISDPNVALLLMVIGLYGLVFEFSSPGVGPGVVGVICLVLGLYALNQLPVDYAGLVLIILGIALMAAEAFTPAFGVLGAGGIVAFVIGAAMLIDTDVPEYQVSWETIAGTAALSLIFVLVVIRYVVQAQLRPVRSGVAVMVGSVAEVLDWAEDTGRVRVMGELWQATGPRGLQPGDRAHVRALDGLTLTIEPGDAPDEHGEHQQ
ncbi:MAG: nodulation protein NfeD [Pseudomonadota bacterium]